MNITKIKIEELSQIITNPNNIENNVSNLIQLLIPDFDKYEKPITKIWEIKKEIMYFIEQSGINYESDEYIHYYTLLDEKLSQLLLKMTMKKHDLYYKNILKEESFEQFEKIVTLLQGEVQFFYENLFYTQKILNFINEFNKEGAFSSDLLFLKTFLETATSNMVLIACKLFFNGSINTKRGTNISFSYLRQYIHDNRKKEENIPTAIKNVSSKMKDIEKDLQVLTELRNTYIAHYQIKEEATKKQLNIQLLQKIFNSACIILEELSLMYFQGKDIGSYNFIMNQGFKQSFCQNLVMDKIQKTDIDSYFDYLKTHFIKELIK